MMNFLRPFVPKFSAVANTLYPLTSVKVDLRPLWTQPCQDAFDSLRALLTKAPLLRLPDFNRKFFVATDASQYGLGAALFQTDEAFEGDPLSAPVKERRCIALISRSLTKGERGYSTTKRELLAIVFALKRLRYYLWGHHFHLFTDHSALTYMFTQTHTNPLIEGWFETLMDFQFDISHCPGVENVLPDALSRLFSDALRRAPSGKPIRLMRTEVLDPRLSSTDAWKLNPLIFNELLRTTDLSLTDVELFSSSYSNLLKNVCVDPATFVTGGSGTPEGFKASLMARRFYAKPPWRLIHKTVDHLRQQRAKGLLITPHVASASWFNTLLRHSACSPIIIKPERDTFLSGSTDHKSGIGQPPWGGNTCLVTRLLQTPQTPDIVWLDFHWNPPGIGIT
jgi:hypothetical protein